MKQTDNEGEAQFTLLLLLPVPAPTLKQRKTVMNTETFENGFKSEDLKSESSSRITMESHSFSARELSKLKKNKCVLRIFSYVLSFAVILKTEK